ncbi:MAG TPA: TonB-dependent receptor [Candidatus Binatia bacterium]|nr:TonB-dependent receptor [Candidatus Binatia bacterium]
MDRLAPRWLLGVAAFTIAAAAYAADEADTVPVGEDATAAVAPAAAPDAAPAPAPAPGADLLDLDLRQLAELTVTSVSRKREPLTRAPAAVYVITADQIRRSGARTLPELLRGVPGLHVARINSRIWAISARGFNSRLVDKLEVLQDGRTLYTPLFSGVFWDVQMPVLEDVERVEIIRGPGGTLWGANAVNGVINIITKAAADTQGVLASATAGDEFDDRAVLRWGFAPFGAAARVWLQHLQLDGTQRASGGNAGDGWNQLRGGVRVDWSGWTLQGEAYGGDEQNGSGGSIGVDGSFLQLGRVFDHDSGRQEQVQAYYQRSVRDVEQGFAERRDTVNVDFQQHVALRIVGDLVWGAGWRRSADEVRNSPTLEFDPASRAVELWSAFAQDEVRFGENFSLAGGAKVEHNDFTGFELQPDLRFSWAASEHTTFWGAVARAVRTPSRLEHDATIVGGGGGSPDDAAGDIVGGVLPPPPDGGPTAQDCIDAGGSFLLCHAIFDTGLSPQQRPRNQQQCEARGLPASVCAQLFDPAARSDLFGDRGFRSEELLSYQLGWRQALGEAVSVDLALFWNDYDRLRGIEHDGDDVRVANSMRGTAWGAELTAYWQPAARWQLRGSYSWLRLDLEPRAGSTDDRTEANEGNDPRHRASLRADWQVSDRWSASSALRYVAALPALGVPAYTEAEVGGAWQPLSWLAVDVQGRNLLHADHVEYGTADASRIPRAAYLTLRASW